MNELVSILIPAYNAENWIAEAIQSALNQTWPKKEVIVIDDGSSDGTCRIASPFASRTVKVIRQDNQGASAARNKALFLAQGDYVQWLDADNLLAPDKISRQMEAAEVIQNRRVLLTSAWGSFFYRLCKAEFLPDGLWQDLSPVEWLYRKLANNLYMVPETWLVSRELTEAAGTWDERLSLDDDGEYFVRVLTASEGTRFIREARSYYRCGNMGSLSSVVKRPDTKLASQFLSMRLHIEALLSMEDSARTRAACLQFLQRWLIFFYPDKTDILEEAHALARGLGGTLTDPELKKKYALMLPVLGWRLTKQLNFSLPAFKLQLRKNFDRLMFSLSGDKAA